MSEELLSFSWDEEGFLTVNGEKVGPHIPTTIKAMERNFARKMVEAAYARGFLDAKTLK